MPLNITVAFQGPHGFVTDLGAPVPLEGGGSFDGRALPTLNLPRFGVWKHTGRKFEVVLATEDREAAIAEASRPGLPRDPP